MIKNLYHKILLIIICSSLSSIGAGIFTYALLLDYTSFGGEEWRGGLILSIYYLAKIILTPFIGTFTDRQENRINLILINQIGGLLLYIPILYINRYSSVGYSLLLIMLTAEIILGRISVSATTCLIKDWSSNTLNIGKVIAFQETCDKIVGITAPIIGAYLLSISDVRLAIKINIISYIPAIIIIGFILIQNPERESSFYKSTFAGSLRSLSADIKEMFSCSEVAYALAMIMVLNAFWAAFPLYLSALVGNQGLNKNIFGFGMATYNIGFILISMLIAKGIVRTPSTVKNTLALLLIPALLIICNYLFKTTVSLFTIMLFIGAGIGAASISLNSMVISFSPRKNVAGVSGTIASIGNILSPIFVALYGYIIRGRDPTITMIALNLSSLLIIIVIVRCFYFYNKQTKTMVKEVINA